ncbi:major histocompatibility complex class I-related gene protein-like isoform X2 [Anabas testudineus]|uniref:major histocompatibility complex class I-related gene protein-like isoform X2 n=1 Tax=Anabas testudineus TaxID=64144 RepID=UPI00143DCD98|nr:major histocompatibility complex class I-related gene protein-like isoform X2 [Anabas testudineus]
MKLILLFLFCPIAFSAKHTLRYTLTAASGIPNLPEFVAVALVDNVEIGYCDSHRINPEPKTDWSKKGVELYPNVLDWYTYKCERNQRLIKMRIESLKKHFICSTGACVFQRMNGCDWDDQTADTSGFNRYGCNGEDFITFDLKTLTWVGQTSQADIIKQEWDRDTRRIRFWNNTLTYECLHSLKEYVAFGKSSLQRTDPPSVSLLQKTPSSPVSCHATGFYPDRASMFWRKDGEEIHEDVDHGEILPNHDGTFQMRVDLNISSVKPEDWSRYDCVFQFSDVKKDVITKLDKAEIRTNWVPPSDFLVAAVTGGVVGLLLLLVCITGLFIWRKNDNRIPVL